MDYNGIYLNAYPVGLRGVRALPSQYPDVTSAAGIDCDFARILFLLCTIIYEDWRSDVRTPWAEKAVNNRLQVLKILPAWRITDKAYMFHNQTKRIEPDIQGWCWSECVEFYLCAIGWRPLNSTYLSLDFVDEPNHSGGGGKSPVCRWLRPWNTLSKLTSNSIPNCSNNKLDLLRWLYISAEINAYHEFTIKFTESSSEMFRKRLFMNIGEGRFREFNR
jgi:hypothetical protein